jgi:hypothetical protein
MSFTSLASSSHVRACECHVVLSWYREYQERQRRQITHIDSLTCFKFFLGVAGYCFLLLGDMSCSLRWSCSRLSSVRCCDNSILPSSTALFDPIPCCRHHSTAEFILFLLSKRSRAFWAAFDGAPTAEAIWRQGWTKSVGGQNRLCMSSIILINNKSAFQAFNSCSIKM